MSANAIESPGETDDNPGPGRRRRRQLVVAGAAVVVVVLAVAAVRWSGTPPSSLQRSGSERRAPPVVLPELGAPERTLDLAAFAGRPVVVNFWASWCVPCRREMPALQRAARRFAGRVAFVGINHQDDEQDALELVRRAGVRYPSGYDPGGDVARDFELFGMPTTVFIDDRGRVVASRTGEMSERELTTALDELFGITPS